MQADVTSAFDIAFWFLDTAENQSEYIQPQKLQRLMFLAQAYYVVAFNGRKLMPAVFVADEMGPIEPNIYAAFSKGRPDVDVDIFLPVEIEAFMDSLWRRFGHYSADRLARLTKDTLAYKQAYNLGKRTEITLDAMRLSFTRAESTPAVDQVVKPKVMRTQTGRSVVVKAWDPTAKKPPSGA